jgi:PKD repeat protein
MRKIFLLFALVAGLQSAHAQCSPSFTWTPNPVGSELLRTLFDNSSTYTTTYGGDTTAYARYTFTYGDGTSASWWSWSGSTFTHDYADTGTYIATLDQIVIIFDSVSGYTDTICNTTTSDTIDIQYAPCASVIDTSYATISTTEQIIDFSAYAPSGSSISYYSWTFGDGTTSTLSAPAHTYTSDGYYHVTLLDSAGGCGYVNSIYVFVTSIYDCSVDTAHAYAAVSGSTVNFSCSNTPATFGSECRYSWTFGDGSTSTAANPAHTYTIGGTYTATVTVDWNGYAPDSTTHDSTAFLECSATATVTVTVDSLNRISGYVYTDWSHFDSTTLCPSGCPGNKVLLIKYDSVAGTLTAIDSTTCSTFGGYYEFMGVPAGSYRIKTYIIGEATGSGYIPTYADSAAHWSDAHAIHHATTVEDNVNVYMLYGTVSSGPGFISGSVYSGAGRTMAGGSGTPVAGMQIQLFTAANVLWAFAYTNDTGLYTFSNLPLGTYYVYPEVINYGTTPATSINVTSSTETVSAVNFLQDASTHTIVPLSLSVSSVNAASNVQVYPNPTTGNINVSWKLTSTDEDATLSITDVTGKSVYSGHLTMFAGSGTKALTLSELQAGIYFVHIRSTSLDYNGKLTVE